MLAYSFEPEETDDKALDSSASEDGSMFYEPAPHHPQLYAASPLYDAPLYTAPPLFETGAEDAFDPDDAPPDGYPEDEVF